MAKHTESVGAAGAGEAASRLIITEIAPEQDRETQVKSKTAGTRRKSATAKPKKAAVKTKAAEPREEAVVAEPKASEPESSEGKSAESKPAAAKARKSAAPGRKIKVKIKDETGETLEIGLPVDEPVKDPVGDISDGEARSFAGAEAAPEPNAEMAAYRADAAEEAAEGMLEAHNPAEAFPSLQAASPEAAIASQEDEDAGEEEVEADEPEIPEIRKAAQPRPPAKLERLQKILSKAGIASRRRAEAMIEAGRVMVNGTVVTQLGAKADAARDHIRVDGKMLEGAEIHRYYVLNKPRGFVTTVSDPEGRPTVMQFFEKMRERLYPVGRLDFMTEGLLVVTNDGDLANQLTKASSAVEKTYLVKVAGQPTEEELDLLRAGVQIERGKPGSAMVKTSPAQVRQVRQGDNPWYEVILIEGRNRELRKMFEQIGHFVEKIRRVGYGPLVLDLEPGKLRELDPEEVAKLRLTAEGKLKARRIKVSKLLPKEAGRAVEPRRGERPPRFDQRAPRAAGAWAHKTGGVGARPFRAPAEAEGSPQEETGRPGKPAWKPRGPGTGGVGERRTGARPPFGKTQGERPQQGQRFGAKPGFDRPQAGRPAFGQPAGEQADRKQRRADARPGSAQPFRGKPGSDAGPKTRFDRPGAGFRPQREQEPQSEGASGKPGERPAFKRQDGPRRFGAPAGKSFGRPAGRDAGRGFDRPSGKSFGKPAGRSFDTPPGRSFDKPAARSFDRPAGGRFDKGPAQSVEGQPPALFDKAPGRTRDSQSLANETQNNKAWSKGPAKSWEKGGHAGPRPSRPAGSSPAFRGRPAAGGTGRPATGGRSKPAFGSRPASGSKPAFGSKPGFKSRPGGSRPGSGSKPGGFKRSAPRPGGRKRG